MKTFHMIIIHSFCNHLNINKPIFCKVNVWFNKGSCNFIWCTCKLLIFLSTTLTIMRGLSLLKIELWLAMQMLIHYFSIITRVAYFYMSLSFQILLLTIKFYISSNPLSILPLTIFFIYLINKICLLIKVQ
jgi:hypothetical protein